MNEREYDVLVIGGGASGMFAAYTAAAKGKKVLLLERNRRLGEKLRITGGGRCNVLNAEKDETKLLKNYGEAEQALYSSFSEFGMEKAYAFFESKGIPLKVEARSRAFPVSEKALDIVKLLESCMKDAGVEVRLGVGVTGFKIEHGRVQSVSAGGREYRARSYILATGGVSHPETGSTGDGFAWLKGLGHTVEDPTPSIVPLKSKDPWVRMLSGAKAEQAKITFMSENGKKFSRTGPILFTHFGVSGPTILNAASLVADYLQEGRVTAVIDLYPGKDIGALDAHVTKVFDQNKNKLLKNVFKELVPSGTSDVILARTGVYPETKVHSVRKEDRRRIVDTLKGLTLTISGLMGFERAVVADGGVILREMDMRTMRSKKLENLYVIGDLLHIVRPSGGYSLQLCWTSGYVAGMNA